MNGSFHGGLALPPDQALLKVPITRMTSPARVVLPVESLDNNPAEKLLVASGDHVKIGQPIAYPRLLSPAVIATISGVVKAIEERSHSDNIAHLSVVIENDGREEYLPDLTSSASAPSDAASVMKAARIGGIFSGAMGRGIASDHRKWSIRSVIMNGVADEPFIAAGYRLMVERPDDVLAGLKLFMTLYDVERATIAIAESMSELSVLFGNKVAGDKRISIAQVVGKFPQGNDHLLVRSVTRRELSPRFPIMDQGFAICDPSACIALFEAAVKRLPLIERVISIAGIGIPGPRNLKVRIGTPVRDIIVSCGGTLDNGSMIVINGPMRGHALTKIDSAITGDVAGILFMRPRLYGGHLPCVMCGKCLSVCPVRLFPSDLGRYVERGLYGLALEENVLDCIECGCCAYVCPSRRPLAHFMKLGKSEAARGVR
jgi:Na+-translocating ferredoxin:NAD+ oxidoreductase subunit C